MSVKSPYNLSWFRRIQCFANEFPSSLSKNRRLDQDALYFACFRGFETEREDAIIFDPFASRYINSKPMLRNSMGILTLQMKNMWQRYVNVHGLPPEWEYRHEFLLEDSKIFASAITGLAIRTRFFDDAIERAVKKGINQIVILNGGLDTRPWRLQFLTPNQTIFQVLDRPSLEKLEAKFLMKAKPDPLCERKVVVSPLSKGAESVLNDLDLDFFDVNKPCIVVFRNMTKLFNEESYGKFVSEFCDKIAPGSHFCADLIGATLWGKPMEEYEHCQAWIDVHNKFITDKPAEFFQKYGLRATAYSTKNLNYEKRFSAEPGASQNYWHVRGYKPG